MRDDSHTRLSLHERLCAACGACVGVCPQGALRLSLKEWHLAIGPTCTVCGACVSACPTGALVVEPSPKPLWTPHDRAFLPCYDVVVVGAGPGGSMAAWAAANAGASVLLIEKRQEIGSPVRCAEGVPASELEVLVDVHPTSIANTVHRARIDVLDISAPAIVPVTGEGGRGYVLERRVFDRELAVLAALAGAEVRVKVEAIGLLWQDGRVAGVKLQDGISEREVPARIVIGADGIETWVGRWAGLTKPIPLRDHMVCAQYLLAGIDIDPDCLRYWLSSALAPGGYIWLFPKGERLANVGLGMQADLMKEPARYALDRFIESQPELNRGSAVTFVAGGVPVASSPARLVANGVMLVGDAARQVDPLTGGGIITAMHAGRLAGEVAAQAICAGDVSAESLSLYQDRWMQDWGRRLARNYRLRQRFPPSVRHDPDFLRVFAVAVAGK